MNCVHCQQQHALQDTYCSITGKAIDESVARKYTYETMDFCVSCGQSNEKNALHCSQCGTSLFSTATKNKVGQMLDQSLTAIPELTRNVDFEKGKRTVKKVSQEHGAYIKRTPLILLPAAISIVIMLLITAVIVQQIENDVALIGEVLDLGGVNIFDAAALSETLADELGVDMDVPKLPIFALLLAMMHNIDLSLSLEGLADGQKSIMQLHESNIFLGFLIVPVVALFIGAVVYGMMAKKQQWHFWRGIIYSTILYTVFLIITSVMARYKIKASGLDFSDEAVSLTIKLAPSLVDAVISGVLVSGVMFTFVAYITYAGRNIISQLERGNVYVKYVMYGLAATAVGMCVQLVNAFIAVKSSTSSAADDLMGMFITQQIPSGAYFIGAMYTAVANWYLTLFGKLNIQAEYGDLGYTWFFKDGLYAREMAEIIHMTTFMPPLLLALLTFALLAAIGYALTKFSVLSIKETAIVAGIFAAIQVVLLYVVNIQIETIIDSDVTVVQISIAIIRQLITTALFAFAAIYAGSFGKVKWRQRA